MAAGMGDETRRFSSGDRWTPTATVLNGWQDAADYVRDRERGGGTLPGRSALIQGSIIKVKNTSGADCDRLAVLGIDAPIFSPDDNLDAFRTRVGLKGVTPILPDHQSKWVVLLRPLANGASGPALAAGVVPVRVYVNDLGDQYCDVGPAKTFNDETVYLGTGDRGAQILWLEAATVGTIAWALVRIANCERGAAFVNGSTDTAPAYGVLRVGGGYDSHATLLCYKPDTTFSRLYAINSPSDVPAAGRGTCSLYAPLPVKALYDPSSMPAYGDSYGAKPGQWYLAKHYPGFIFVGMFDSVAHIGYFQPEPIMTLIGTVNTSLSPGSGGQVSLYMGGTGSDTDSTLDLAAADWFSATGTTFGTGAKVMLQWCNGLWLVSPRLAPRLYCGLLPSALTATTASVANCQLFPLDESGDVTAPGSYGNGGLVATVYNVLNPSGSGGFIGDSGTPFKACWNAYLSRYEFFDMPCAAS